MTSDSTSPDSVQNQAKNQVQTQIQDSGYTAKDIQVLEGLEGVRRRPGMYIGDTYKRGLHHLVYEIVDNSIDEALAGHCKKITVQLKADGSVMVTDDGRGIPVDKHSSGKSALEIIASSLHAGGKFEKKAYAVSGGLHGVGMSVVNALSEWMKLEVHREGRSYTIGYSRGKMTEPFKAGDPIADRGTIVSFKPDSKIFATTEFDFDYLKERIMELAFLNKGLRISIAEEKSGKNEEFYFEGGIIEFVKHLNQARNKLHEPFYIKKTNEGVEVEVAIQYTDSYNEMIYSFVNDIKTIEGGTHMVGFRTALTRVINDYTKSNKIVKEEHKITGDDAIEGVTAIVSVKVPEPQFEGQTKTKLGNSEVRGLVDSEVYEGLKTYLEEHPHEAKVISNKVVNSMEAREAAQKAKDLIRRKGIFESSLLPGKLADCIEENPVKSELFLVEGDSAGGSSKQARDRQTQAILPLRGKILNVEKAPIHKVLTSEEIKNIVLSLGAGFKEDFNIEKARYHKVVIMSVDFEEPTVIMDPSGKISIVKIGEFIDSHPNDPGIGNHRVLCFDVKTNKTTFKPIKKIISHEISEPLFEIKTAYGRTIRVTSSHSLFVYENGLIALKKTSELKEGDLVVAPAQLPLNTSTPQEQLDLLEEFVSLGDKLDANIFVRGEEVLAFNKNRILSRRRDNPQLTEARIGITPELRREMKKARLDAELSQDDVCQAIGISQLCTFYSWENGATNPTATHFKKYMDAVGLGEDKCAGKIRMLPSRLEQTWDADFRNSGCNELKDWIKVSDLDKSDISRFGDVKLSPAHYAHKGVNRYVPIDEDLMFILGLFTADGSCSQRNGVRFAIGGAKIKFAAEVKNKLEKLFGVEANIYKGRGASEVRTLNSVVSVLFRQVFGFGGMESATKRIPSIVFNVSKDLQLAYLKGFLFGDGTLSEKGIRFATSSKELANDLAYLLLGHGVMASISIIKPSGKPTIIRGKEVITKLDSYHISIVNRNGITKLQETWKEHAYAAQLTERLALGHKSGFNGSFVEISGDLIAIPIISKKEVAPSRRMVYDFSVHEDENFIAGFGALCAHNTDADVDGSHIRTLILTLFYRYFKPFIEKGYIYIAQPPLYRIAKGKTVVYAYNDAQLAEYLKTMGDNPNIQRYKGLGEMNPDQLWDTTMNPESRTLKQVTIEDGMLADELFTVLMGDEVEPRRKFIEKYASEVKNLDI